MFCIWLTFTAALQTDTSLRFGCSSAMLVLERWDLAQTQAPFLTGRHNNGLSLLREANVLTQSVVKHALTVLSEFGDMVSSVGIAAAYDLLLGSYAGVTLVEFADYLLDIEETLNLMQRVDQQRGHLQATGPVLTWAMNMMLKKSLDQGKNSADYETQGTSQQGTSLSHHWVPPVGLLNIMEDTETDGIQTWQHEYESFNIVP